MPRRILSTELLTQTLRGQQVVHVTMDKVNRVVIHFSDGTTLAIETNSAELNAAGRLRKGTPTTQGGVQQPTKRQFEYLAFIAKYIARFGRAPAESDIERHFLVSAPSVNQMMQMLERRGFIARQPGVPRSIRICIELPQHAPS